MLVRYWCWYWCWCWYLWSRSIQHRVTQVSAAPPHAQLIGEKCGYVSAFSPLPRTPTHTRVVLRSSSVHRPVSGPVERRDSSASWTDPGTSVRPGPRAVGVPLLPSHRAALTIKSIFASSTHTRKLQYAHVEVTLGHSSWARRSAPSAPNRHAMHETGSTVPRNPRRQTTASSIHTPRQWHAHHTVPSRPSSQHELGS